MAEKADGVAASQVQRMKIHRVMIDTPALLNMVKHCRGSGIKTSTRGQLMGVLKDSISQGQQLLIT